MSSAADALAARCARPGCCRPGRPWSCCSPAAATRSACSTSRCCSPGRTRSARCTSTTACAPESGERPGGVRGALPAARASRCTVERVAAPAGAGQPPGLGARRALRRGRARSPPARGARLAAGHTTTDQAETILYRLAASPGRRALLGMPERRGLLVRPLLAAGVDREETGAWCAARGLAVGRGREQRRRTRSCAGASARGRSRRCASCTRRPRRTCCAPPSCCATRPRCSTSWSTRRSPAATAIALGHLGALPPALARLVVRRLAEDAAGGLCPRAAARLPELLALGGPAARARDARRRRRRARRRRGRRAALRAHAAPRAAAPSPGERP